MRGEELSRFEALLEAALPAAGRVARALAGSSHSEDLLADAVATALVEFHRLRDESRFTAWLLAIMRNRYRMMLRRRRLRTVVPLHLASEPSAGKANPGGGHWLDAMLGALKPAEKEAVVLHYLEGFSVAEAAGIAHTTPGALKMRLARARKRLAELLRENEP